MYAYHTHFRDTLTLDFEFVRTDELIILFIKKESTLVQNSFFFHLLSDSYSYLTHTIKTKIHNAHTLTHGSKYKTDRSAETNCIR